MMTRLQMKNAPATLAAIVPVPVPAPATLAAPAAAPAAIPDIPIVYPSMFDRWSLPL